MRASAEIPHARSRCDPPGPAPLRRRAAQILEEQGAEQIAEEQLQGRRTGVYRVTDEAGKRELWGSRSTSPGLPLRLEIYDRAHPRPARHRLDLNWQKGSMPIPDSVLRARSYHPPPPPGSNLDEYVARTIKTGPVGPVPVLYAKLLYRERRN